MKKLLLLVLILMLALTACNREEETTTNGGTNNANGTGAANDADANGAQEEEEEAEITGVIVTATRNDDSGSSVSIIIGSGADAWPYAEIQEEDEPAFVPVAGATYRLTYVVTSGCPDDGATGWRVRWMTSDGSVYPEYTQGDRDVVTSAAPYSNSLSPDDVATHIPAHFNAGIDRGETYTLVVEITLDGDQGHDELIGNIVLRGSGGNEEWFARSVTVELLSGGPGSDAAETLVNWVR
jgi:hypothetical protein